MQLYVWILFVSSWSIISYHVEKEDCLMNSDTYTTKWESMYTTQISFCNYKYKLYIKHQTYEELDQIKIQKEITPFYIYFTPLEYIQFYTLQFFFICISLISLGLIYTPYIL